MKMKYLYFILFFSLFSLISAAQEIGFPIIRNYTPKEYNNRPQVFSAVQDSLGIMYFGVGGGVMEYDGVSWRYIQNEKQAIPFDLALDKKGKIYVAANDEFGFLTIDKNGNTIYQSLTYLIHDTTFKIGIVRSVKITSQFVYFPTYDAILQYSPYTENITIFKSNTNGRVFGDFIDQDIYYTRMSQKGLMKIENNELITAHQANFFKKRNGFNIVIPYDSATLLIPTCTEGLYLYQPNKDTIPQKLNISFHNFIADNYIYNASVVQKEYFVLGSLKKGALLMDKHGTVLQRYQESNLLQTNQIYEIITDTSQNLWFGLNNGLSKTEHSQDLSFWDKNNGLKELIISIIRYNKRIYIATSSKVYFIDKNNQVQEFQNMPKEQNWCFLENKISKSLLAGNSKGIYEIKGDKVVQIYEGNHAYKIYQSIINPYRVLSTDGDSFISLKYKNGKWTNEGKWEGIKEEVRGIIEDEKGEIWLGTYLNGVIRITPDYENITKPNKIQYYNKKDGFVSLKNILPFKFKNKIIWGTEKGLYIYNSENHNFEPFCEFGEQFCNGTRDVYSLKEMPDGKIWIFPSENIKADLGYLQPNIKGGYDWVYAPFRRLPSMFLEGSYIEPTGIAWIGGSEGLYRYDMGKDTKNYAQHYYCLIRKITVGVDSIIYGGNTSKLHLSGFKNPIGLAYKYNSLKFEFAAPFFDQEEKTLYSYQLIGYDKEWTKWSREFKKEYTNLHEGTYTFQVKARNVYDVESETSNYQITILPPLYRSWWAFCIYIILSGSLVFIIVKLNSRRLQRDKEHLEGIVIQRTAEIRQQKEEIQIQAKELEKLSIVASETDNSIAIADAMGNLEWVNEGFTRMYGYTFENLIQLNFKTLFDFSITPNIKENIEYCLQNKGSRIYESLNRTKSGENIWAQTTITPILDNSGNVIKIIAIDSDISKLKLAETEILQHKTEIEAQRDFALQQKEFIEQQNTELEKHRTGLENLVSVRTAQLEIAKEKAEESDRLKSAFLANMSHEIRTPMNAIIGFSHLLVEEEITNADREKYVKLIVHNSSSLLHLIDDIINISIIEAGQIRITKQICNINDIFHELFQVYLVKLNSSKDKDIVLLPEIDQMNTIFNIYSDPEHLIQILSNLLDNAIKFTEKGFIHFGYELMGQSGNQYLRFYVKDTGTGLTEDQQSQLFIHFSKAHESKEKLYRGAGLGLSICKNLVELLGGKIWVESEVNVGSTFYFTLPFQISERIDDAGEKSEKLYQLSNLQGKTILIAEDEDSNYEFLVAALSKSDVKIIHAYNGLEAIEIVKNTTVDLILMDVKMPKMNGLEATKIIKSMGKNIPIIAQTAFAFESDEITGYQSGCDAYISKPINKPKLFDLLNQFIK